MRSLIFMLMLAFGMNATAGETLRVGQQVLSVGDTAVHVIDLLGTPGYKEPVQNEFGASLGERWQFSRDDHVLIITIIAGKVSSIEDRPDQDQA